MAEILYKAHIRYDQITIKKLGKVWNEIINKYRRIAYGALSAVFLLAGGCGRLSTGISTVLLFFGCMFFIGINHGAYFKSKEISESFNNGIKTIVYEFRKEGITVRTTENRLDLDYKQVIRWAENKDYIFFITENSDIFMLSKRSVIPAETDAFCRFLRKYSSADWELIDKTNIEKLIDFFKGLK